MPSHRCEVSFVIAVIMTLSTGDTNVNAKNSCPLNRSYLDMARIIARSIPDTIAIREHIYQTRLPPSMHVFHPYLLVFIEKIIQVLRRSFQALL